MSDLKCNFKCNSNLRVGFGNIDISIQTSVVSFWRVFNAAERLSCEHCRRTCFLSQALPASRSFVTNQCTAVLFALLNSSRNTAYELNAKECLRINTFCSWIYHVSNCTGFCANGMTIGLATNFWEVSREYYTGVDLLLILFLYRRHHCSWVAFSKTTCIDPRLLTTTTDTSRCRLFPFEVNKLTSYSWRGLMCAGRPCLSFDHALHTNLFEVSNESKRRPRAI